MSLSLRTFLKAAKQPTITSRTISIVCGNESADLDSICSALTYAYFQYLKNPNNQNLLLPVIIVSKDDLKLRRDIVHILKEVNIDESLLFFIEDIRKWSQNNSTIEAVLVDHNEVVNEAKKYISKVVGVIDHHKDVNLYSEVTPRIIKVCGSCSSLVFKYCYDEYLKMSEHNLESLKDVARLCLGAGVVDTTNFTHRVEQPDLDVLPLYEEMLPEVDRTAFCKALKQAKNDIYGLSARDLLRKDYKQFEFSKGTSKAIVGISSIVKPVEWLYEQFGGYSSFRNECISYRDERAIAILVIMTAFVSDGQFRRQLVVVSGKTHQKVAASIIEQVKSQLNLKSDDVSATDVQNTDEFFYQFEQQNIEASRKQVAPYLQKAFETST